MHAACSGNAGTHLQGHPLGQRVRALLGQVRSLVKRRQRRRLNQVHHRHAWGEEGRKLLHRAHLHHRHMRNLRRLGPTPAAPKPQG